MVATIFAAVTSIVMPMLSIDGALFQALARMSNSTLQLLMWKTVWVGFSSLHLMTCKVGYLFTKNKLAPLCALKKEANKV